jgi:hypothetical protein
MNDRDKIPAQPSFLQLLLYILLIVVIVVFGILPVLESLGPGPVPVAPPVPTPVPTPSGEPIILPVFKPGPVQILVAAADADPSTRRAADFCCDGAGDQAEIQQALDRLGTTGGTVFLSQGTFQLSGSIRPRSQTVIAGQGPEETTLVFSDDGILKVDSPYVSLENFSVAGSGYSDKVEWLGVLLIRASHVGVQDVVGTADDSIQAVFYVLADDRVNQGVIEDIAFIRCRADNPGTYGFLHNAWGPENFLIRDVRYESCEAINCGHAARFNPWVTGFNFAEQNDVEQLRVVNCSAEGSWESGFHFEWDPQKRDCILVNCTSTGNGRKPYPASGGGEYFASGYYAPGGGIIFHDCTAKENSQYGYYITSGGSLFRCSDEGVGSGRTDYSIITPAAFYVVPWNASDPTILIENCRSTDAGGYGINLNYAAHARVINFTLDNPGGIGGIGALFGDLIYGIPLRDAVVEIYASGDRAPRLVVVVENQNSFYTGRIQSDVADPFTISGSKTANVEVRNLAVVSSTLPSGSSAVRLGETVPVGTVWVIGSLVISPAEAWMYDHIAVSLPMDSTGSLARPDLVVTDIGWKPAGPVPDDPVLFSATVANLGAGATPAGAVHGVLFTIDDGAVPGVWSDTHTSSIGPGESVTLAANGGSAGAVWQATAGVHVVTATVDDVGRILESDDENNRYEETLMVEPLL